MRRSVQLLAMNETGVNEMIRNNMKYSAISVLAAGALFETALPAQAAEPVPSTQVMISRDTSVSTIGTRAFRGSRRTLQSRCPWWRRGQRAGHPCTSGKSGYGGVAGQLSGRWMHSHRRTAILETASQNHAEVTRNGRPLGGY